jgi:clan AA aspartic protease (TIGR02281 family)
MHMTALLCGAALLWTGSAMADDVTTPHGNDPVITKIYSAMQDADLQTVADIYKTSTDPVIHIVSAMVIERMHYNLDASSRDAETCVNTLIDSRPGTAIMCGQFESANLHLAGRDADADAMEAALIKRFEGRGVDVQLSRMKAYANRGNKQPVFAVDVPAQGFTLPLVHSEHDPSPHVKAQANGHEIDLLIDTGAHDVAISEEQASKLGVQVLDTPISFSGWITKQEPGKRGLLKELKVGPAVWHNIPVLIVSNTRVSLMGINMIAPLGSVRISRSTLTVGDAATENTHCDTPMLTSSTFWGDGLGLAVPMPIEGQWSTVRLDTGAYLYLLGTAKALEQATALRRSKREVNDIGGKHLANTDHAKVKLEISGQPIEVYFDVLTDSAVRWPITLGAGALRDMDFLMDFKHQHMCLLLHPDLH